MAQCVALWQINGAKCGIMADLWHKECHYDRFMAQGWHFDRLISKNLLYYDRFMAQRNAL
jgi:hypothetical protein